MYIDHIAIAVDDLQTAMELFSKLLNVKFGEPTLVESQQTLATFAELDNCKLELIEAASDNSPLFPILPHPLKSFVQSHGWGIHHIAFATNDIVKKMDELEIEGLPSLEEKPVSGLDAKVCFINPNNTHGVLIELCEKSECIQDDE